MKKNIAIICGGFSSEYDISLKSAKNIAKNLPERYHPFLVILRKDGWFVLLNEQEIPFDCVSFSFQNNDKTIKIEEAIVYIHGDPGENGKVQAYLEMIDIPYYNSGPLASQLSFDKWYCNQFLRGFEIPVAKSIYLDNRENIPDEKEIIDQLGLPVFVKPCDSGSSYGISKVKDASELLPAIQNAFQEGKTVVVEEFLEGVEVTCGVYRNRKTDKIEVLPLTEIVSENDFFDFEAKYKGLSEEITPARISDVLTSKVQEITLKVYQLLNLNSVARVDFMIVNDKPHVIEVNTTPGFSDASILPKMIQTSGITIQDFWGRILP